MITATIRKMFVETIEQPQSTDIADVISQFLLYCECTQQMTISTMRTRRTHLKQFCEFFTELHKHDITEITPNMIDFYFFEYAEHHSPSTVNTGKRIVKALFRYCDERTSLRCTTSPDAIQSRGNRRNRPRYIHDDAIRCVISRLEAARTRTLIEMMYDTGMRIQEACSVSYADIDDLRVYVVGKGGKRRTVYMSKNTRGAIDELVQECGCASGALFGMDAKRARIEIQRAFKKHAGIHMTPHQLRHSFAVRLLMNGCDIVTIQKLLGHADISTTMVYLQIKDDLAEKQYYTAMKKAEGY